MTNLDYVIVNANGGYHSVYDFCTPENAQEIIDRATAKAAETVATYDSHIINYPDRADYWKNCQKEYINAKYEMMTFDEYLARQKKAMISGPVKEITKEVFEDALNCLPPLKWCTRGNVEMFCMREMYTGTFTNQYAYSLVTGKYYTAMVDVTDVDTWINNREFPEA